MVGTHLPTDFVVPRHLVGVIWTLNEEVGYGWVVAGVLAEVLGAIAEFALECFSEERVEGLILTTACVDTAHGKSDHLLQPLQMVFSLARSSQVLGTKGPQVNHPLQS